MFEIRLPNGMLKQNSQSYFHHFTKQEIIDHDKWWIDP